MAVAGAGAGTEPNLWSKLEPEPKIINFGSATLVVVIFCVNQHCEFNN